MFNKYIIKTIKLFLLSSFISFTFSQIVPNDLFQPKLNRIMNDTYENWETLSFFNNYDIYNEQNKNLKISTLRHSLSLQSSNNNFSVLSFNQIVKNSFFGYSYISISNKNVFMIPNHQESENINFKNNSNIFNTISSGFGYKNDWAMLKISKGRENWGAGEHIQLALSNSAEPYNYLTLGSNYRSVRVKYIHGFLESLSDSLNRFITSRGIEWTNKKSLIIGLSETVVYSGIGRSIDLGYFNPISSHTEVELNNRLNVIGDGNSNAVWQFHMDALIKKRYRISLNYLIDEFVFDPDQQIGKEHGLAYSLRISKNIRNNKDEFFTIYGKMVRVGTPTFRHGNGGNNFINKIYPLGWLRGSDSEEFSIGINFSDKTSLLYNLNSGITHSGDENIRFRPLDRYKDYQKGSYPSGNVKKIMFLNTSINWYLNKFLSTMILLNINDNKSSLFLLELKLSIPFYYKLH